MVHQVRALMFFVISVCVILGSLSACTTNPFEPTTDTVSSTSGHSWWNEDGILKSEYKAVAFVAYNAENLEEDVAKGGGEYLTSMGTLLGVGRERQQTFQSAAQDSFKEFAKVSGEARLEQLRALTR